MAARRRQARPQAPQRPTEPPTEARPAGPAQRCRARLNRFISGTAAPGGGAPPQAKNPPHDTDAPPARGDGPPAEAYASELPDLSGPIPRAPQRKSPPDRTPETSSSSGLRPFDGRENREGRETRETVPGVPATARSRSGPACRSAGSIRGAR